MRTLLVFNTRVDVDHPTQAVTSRWLWSLSDKFDKIFVITVHIGRLDLPENVRVYPLASSSADNKIKRVIRLYYFLKKILQREKIDGVFVHQAVVLGALTGIFIRILGKPMLIWYCHREVNLWLRLCHFWALGAISSSVDSFRLGSHKFAITGHGIDTDSFRPGRGGDKRESSFTIGYIGRYSPIKRLEILMDAIKILKENERGDLRVSLYGLCQNTVEERYFSELKNMVEEKGLSRIVTFYDAVNNWKVPSILETFDLFVSQQETGGTDKAILEAMSCGLPVVMATKSFNQYLLEDVVSTLVFASGSADEMAEKIRGIMRLKRGERTIIGLKLRKIVESHHSLKKLSENIHQILWAMEQGHDWKKLIEEKRRENDL